MKQKGRSKIIGYGYGYAYEVNQFNKEGDREPVKTVPVSRDEILKSKDMLEKQLDAINDILKDMDKLDGKK
jgi:hypothetical protein